MSVSANIIPDDSFDVHGAEKRIIMCVNCYIRVLTYALNLMKKKCNEIRSQLSFKDMRIIILIAFLLYPASGAFAQAADPLAIDFSGKMDTIARETQDPFYIPDANKNIGLQNSDRWEDFELSAVRSLFAAQDSSWLHYGGPFILEPPTKAIIADVPVLYGDFDGDGVGDIIGSVWQAFYKGRKTLPYFDTTYTSRFASPGEDFGFIGAIDFDEDGIVDILAGGGEPGKEYILFFKGGKGFVKNEIIYANDSILSPGGGGGILGKFGPHLKPMYLWSTGAITYILKQTGSTISKDSIIIISDSKQIRVTNLYATDITGDGITDLIVSDGLHIYIFKGGDNFGTYPLTPQNAFYTITSPRLTDYENYGLLKNFGSSPNRNTGVMACGDLTGSGIPYLAVDAEINEAGYLKSFTFFYAGGRALDTLFDAVVGYEGNGFNLIFDTLHSINNTGRTVCLIVDESDFNFHNSNLDLLMYRDCENIPHKTNPQMMVGTQAAIDFNLSVFPSIADKFTKVHISSPGFYEGSVTIYNLLGKQIEHRKVDFNGGDNIEFFNTTLWGNGTYIIKIQTANGIRTTKFSIRHCFFHLYSTSYEKDNSSPAASFTVSVSCRCSRRDGYFEKSVHLRRISDRSIPRSGCRCSGKNVRDEFQLDGMGFIWKPENISEPNIGCRYKRGCTPRSILLRFNGDLRALI